MRKENNFLDTLLIITLLIVIFVFCYEEQPNLTSKEAINKSEVCTVKPDTLELTLNNVLTEICKNDIKFPLIVLRQAILETMWFKCTDCSLDYNNCFGYGWDGKTYHKYDNWKESVYAYKQWQDTWYKGGDYYQFLERVGYAETTDYVKRLKAIRL